MLEKYGAKEALKCRRPPKIMRRIGISTIHKPLHAALATQFLSLGKIADKKEEKKSSYIRKFRWERLQSHI
jgi:hypothetical protein